MNGIFHFSLPDFSLAFLSILLEGLPFLLLGTILSGLIDQFLPARLMTRLLPRNPVAGAVVSASLGMVFPMCECGVVPVIRRLMTKGLPVSNAVTYMLAAPIVNPIVAVSTYAAFKGQDPLGITLFRLGAGFAVAVIVGIVVHRIAIGNVLRTDVIADIAQPGGLTSGAGGGSFTRKLWRALNVCVGDFLTMSVYFVIGAMAAATFNTAVNQEFILPLAMNDWLATASLMGLAGVLSVCSTTDAFIAATFSLFPTAAKLGFLVFGPMVDFKLLFIYSAIFRKRFILGLVVGLFILIGLICVRLQVVLDPAARLP
jgi:uncharacterized membrane protein YraQ (UPF0718 family)